jgi:hypothetical protein
VSHTEGHQLRIPRERVGLQDGLARLDEGIDLLHNRLGVDFLQSLQPVLGVGLPRIQAQVPWSGVIPVQDAVFPYRDHRTLGTSVLLLPKAKQVPLLVKFRPELVVAALLE